MKELKEFIRFHIQNSRFAVLLANAKEISSPVVEAIEKLIRKVEDKDINLREVSEPIVEAQKQTTEAVKAIPKTEIDFTGLEARLEALKAVLEEKKLEVNIGETKLDLNPITKAIQKLEKSMPKMEKQVVIDYTALIGEVIQKIEGNKVDLSSLEKCFTNLATSSDLSVLAEWLRVISEKEIILPEFRFDDDGKLLVKVDKVGGGGMGLTSIQEALLQSLSDNQETGLAKETKQDSIIENQTDGTQQAQILPSDSAIMDAFGRVRVSSPETIFDSKNIFDDPNQAADAENQIIFFDNQEVSGTGTSTAYNVNTASQSISVSANTAGKRVRQTKQRFTYQPAKSHLCFLTLIFNATQAGITQREGLFDEQNGIFLEDDGSGYNFVIRSYATGTAVDRKVAQADWNLDKMDGTGASEITIDLTKTNILVFDMEWLGTGRVRMGFVINGLIYYAHEFLNANILSVVYMSKPNLPIRCEIENDGTGSAATFIQICTSVVSEGGQNPLGSVRSVNTGGTHLDAALENTAYALIGIRLHANYLAENVRIIESAIQLQTASHKCIWEVRFNPTVAGTFTYTTLNQSGVQYALGATANTVTGGYVVASGFIESGGPQSGSAGSVSSDLETSLVLGSLIDGTSDTIVLCITPIGGSSNVDAEGSLTWRELN